MLVERGQQEAENSRKPPKLSLDSILAVLEQEIQVSRSSYSYARNNPITKMDPDGKWWKEFATGQQSFNDLTVEVGQATQYLADNNKTWSYAVDNPVKAGLAVGVTSAAAAVAGITSIQAGVSASYVGKMAVGSALYGYVAKNALQSLPDMVKSYSQFNINDSKTWKAPALNTGLMYGPGALGEYVGAIYDIADSVIRVGNQISGGKKDTKITNSKNSL